MPGPSDQTARQWTREETDEFLRFARESFNAGDRRAVEAKLRGGAEYREVGDGEAVGGFKRHEDDAIGECVDELWHSDERMAEVVQDALENAAESYERVRKKGLRDGLELTEAVDRELIATAWKQAFTKSLIKFAVPALQALCARKARCGDRLALSVENITDLEPETIYSLINDHVGVVRNYVSVDVGLVGFGAVGNTRQGPGITRELEFMQFNGVFCKNTESSSAYQNCSTLWVKEEHLFPQRQKETLKAVKKIKRIPYELCKRCKIMLQVISYVRVVLMDGERAKIRRHKDAEECGVVFTVLYIASIGSNAPVHIELDVSGAVRTLQLEVDMLIIMRNNVQYELKPVDGKLFMLNAWITGSL